MEGPKWAVGGRERKILDDLWSPEGPSWAKRNPWGKTSGQDHVFERYEQWVGTKGGI